MNKKRAILLVFILLLVSGGVFLWKNEEEIKGSPDDYIIEEREQGKIVKNEKAGFSMEVPEGWRVEKIEVEEGSIVVYSPSAKGVRPGTIRPPLEEGCMIEVSVLYSDMNLEEIKEEVANNFQSHALGVIKENNFEEIEIKGKTAIKSYFISSDLGTNVDIYVKDSQILYGIGMSMATSSEEDCLEGLDSFLKKISFE